MTISYHPDPGINTEVTADAIEAERLDLAAGYPPRRWTCTCGASHSRGHFPYVGSHRCMKCGYVGAAGVMWDRDDEFEPVPLLVKAAERCAEGK